MRSRLFLVVLSLCRATATLPVSVCVSPLDGPTRCRAAGGYPVPGGEEEEWAPEEMRDAVAALAGEANVPGSALATVKIGGPPHPEFIWSTSVAHLLHVSGFRWHLNAAGEAVGVSGAWGGETAAFEFPRPSKRIPRPLTTGEESFSAEPQAPAAPQKPGLLRKYWWVIAAGVVAFSFMTVEQPQQGGAQGSAQGSAAPRQAPARGGSARR